MLRLAAQACSRLSPEARDVAEIFLRALPPFAGGSVRAVRLYGGQARRFEPETPFDLIVLVDDRTLEVRTALAIAASVVQAETTHVVEVQSASTDDLASPPPGLARALANARREGVDLWVRTGSSFPA